MVDRGKSKLYFGKTLRIPRTRSVNQSIQNGNCSTKNQDVPKYIWAPNTHIAPTIACRMLILHNLSAKQS